MEYCYIPVTREVRDKIRAIKSASYSDYLSLLMKPKEKQ